MNTHSEKKGPWIHYKRNWLPLKGKPDRANQALVEKTHKDGADECLSKDQPITPLAESIREAWKALIVDRTKAKIFLTVGFKVQCSNEEAVKAMSFLLKKINNDLFNHDFGRDPKAGLTGICIIEPHMLSYDFRGQLHFHILLDENPAVKNVNTFRELVYKKMRGIVTKDGRHMMDENVVDVQEIEDFDGLKKLADYLTKASRMRAWRGMENICFVEPKGLTGVGVSYQWNARNY